jgi:hypothetical protein
MWQRRRRPKPIDYLSTMERGVRVRSPSPVEHQFTAYLRPRAYDGSGDMTRPECARIRNVARVDGRRQQ